MDEILVRRLGKPDIKVRGDLIGHAACPPAALPEGDAWSEIQLRQADDGSWVAIGLRMGSNTGGPIGEVQRIQNPKIMESGGVRGLNGDAESEAEAQEIRVEAVMKFFGWSWLAKKMAADLEWDVERIME